MDMSAAALPPRSGHYTKADEKHQLFGLYHQKLNSCAQLMIDAPDFENWLFQHERSKRDDSYVAHPQYPDFIAWTRETKCGARPCCPSKDLPHGLVFPDNFIYWMEGGRW